jgi:hypothetical protein
MTPRDHASERSEPKFWLGQFYVTEPARRVLDLEDVLSCLKRHHTGDWGDLCAEDIAANEYALQNGGRLPSLAEWCARAKKPVPSYSGNP